MSALEKTPYRANAREILRTLSTESTKKKKETKKKKSTTAIGSLKEEKEEKPCQLNGFFDIIKTSVATLR